MCAFAVAGPLGIGREHTIVGYKLRVLKKLCFSLLIFSLLLGKEKGNKRDDISRRTFREFDGLCEGSPKMEGLYKRAHEKMLQAITHSQLRQLHQVFRNHHHNTLEVSVKCVPEFH